MAPHQSRRSREQLPAQPSEIDPGCGSHCSAQSAATPAHRGANYYRLVDGDAARRGAASATPPPAVSGRVFCLFPIAAAVAVAAVVFTSVHPRSPPQAISERSQVGRGRCKLAMGSGRRRQPAQPGKNRAGLRVLDCRGAVNTGPPGAPQPLLKRPSTDGSSHRPAYNRSPSSAGRNSRHRLLTMLTYPRPSHFDIHLCSCTLAYTPPPPISLTKEKHAFLGGQHHAISGGPGTGCLWSDTI